MDEYQTKRLTKWAFHKVLIPKNMFLVAAEASTGTPKKEKREQAPALQM